MAGGFSYLELLASVDPPDPSLFPRFPNGSEHCPDNSTGLQFLPSSSAYAGNSATPGQPNRVLQNPMNYTAEDIYSSDDEDGGSPTPCWLPSSSYPVNDQLADLQAKQYEDISSPAASRVITSDEEQLQDSSDDEYCQPDPFIGLFHRESSSDEDEPSVTPTSASLSFQDSLPDISSQGINSDSEPMYKKRRRHKKGVKLPSCRPSNAMGPIEIAIRGSTQRKTEFIFQPVIGTCFDSAAEAYDFYNLYSWEKGFGISYGRSDTNRGNQYRTMQELQCASQGIDKRCIHQSQRCGCKAFVRLLRTEDHGWYISKFEEEHNHPFSESYGEKMSWGSHRRIDECARNIIKYLRDSNVPLGKVHSIMGSVYGSVQDLPFTKRSLRTLCQQLAREQMDDDVKKTLDIFRKMRKEDPDFSYSVEVDKHNRIKTLIWTNHRSKMQYQCFGDVFTFDTTYCTNIYKMPFGLFVGVNNHFQSVIFAGVLMRKETIKSFTWVFNEFLSLMGGKAPMTILTDQAPAMLPAVRKSMPTTTHLWCKWHVLRKAQESLGPVYSKKSAFRQEFHKVINEMLTIDEFETAWETLISKYRLKRNPFMIRIYESRIMWAKPYSKGQFCARMMSTQRGESANHILKTYVKGMSCMNNFVSKYNEMIFDRAMEEDREEHKSKMVKKSGARMWPIQNHAYKIYTRATFKLFTIELEKSYHYVVAQEGSSNKFIVNHAYSEIREPWVRVSFSVTVSRERGIYECECGLFTHFGILCCHSIRILNYLGVSKIPDRYIMKRWTKDARDILPASLRFLQKDTRALKSHTCRDNLLYGTTMKAVKEGNHDIETFTEMMKHFSNGLKAVQDIIIARGEALPEQQEPLYESSDNEWHRAQVDGSPPEQVFRPHGKTIYSDDRAGAIPSDFDMSKLKAPLVPKRPVGRSRLKRFLSPVEGKSSAKKKSKASKSRTVLPFKQTSFCGQCRLAGHKKNNCPQNKGSPQKKKNKSRCSTCQMPGHNSLNCHSFAPDIESFDINDMYDDHGDE